MFFATHGHLEGVPQKPSWAGHLFGGVYCHSQVMFQEGSSPTLSICRISRSLHVSIFSDFFHPKKKCEDFCIPPKGKKNTQGKKTRPVKTNVTMEKRPRMKIYLVSKNNDSPLPCRFSGLNTTIVPLSDVSPLVGSGHHLKNSPGYSARSQETSCNLLQAYSGAGTYDVPWMNPH